MFNITKNRLLTIASSMSGNFAKTLFRRKKFHFALAELPLQSSASSAHFGEISLIPLVSA